MRQTAGVTSLPFQDRTRNLHNLLTLRGAQVRDPRIWSRYLNEAIELFAADTDVAFAMVTP